LIDFNTDVVSSITLNQLAKTPIVKNLTSNIPEKDTVVDNKSTNVSVSISAKDSLINTTEENAATGLDLIKTANDALGEIHDSLLFMKDVLTDLPNYADQLAVLNLLDEQSNILIDKIIEICNNTEFNGVKIFSGAQSLNSTAILDNYQNFVFSLGTNADIYSQMIVDTKIDIEGLQSIRNLDIDDEAYADKIDNVIKEVSEKRKKLQEQGQKLQSVLDEIYNSNEAVIANSLGDVAVINSKDLQSQIIQNANTTLQSVSNISADSVLNLLKRV